MTGEESDTELQCGSTKPRRPDRAVYVPRALRTTAADATEPDRSGHTTDRPKCPKSLVPHPVPHRAIDRNFCNVYTPPPLRNQIAAADTAPSIPNEPATEDSAFNETTNSVQVGDNFYIGDYFTNGQLGLYTPVYYSDYPETPIINDTHDTMTETRNDNIIDEYSSTKDEDDEKNELRRASREINRSSKRIIKQSFDSDVLVISDHAEKSGSPEKKIEGNIDDHDNVKDNKQLKPKRKLEAKVSLKREDNDWEAVFDESGDCLDPSLLEELSATVGRVHITTARHSYAAYQSRGQALLQGPLDDAFPHVVEVYDFPSEFKTNDLLALFSEYKDTGFEIKWVDDTHALIVFSSSKIAAEVVAQQRPLARCRPLHAATHESRNKAKKCAEFLQPYRQRPETCTALARRLVSGALGVKLSTARQERAEERRLIALAKEKKRQAALHKEEAWDGSLANQSPTDTGT